MDTSDIIASVALGIALVSAVFSGLAWWANRRSARANEGQAREAEQQTALMRQQLDIERQVRAEQANARLCQTSDQARLVSVRLSGIGALAVEINNGSALPVMRLELECVRASDKPDLMWRINTRVFGAGKTVEILDAGESHTFPVEFTDDDGELIRFAGSTYEIVYSFTDAAGRRWKRTGNGEPELVENGI